LVTVYNREHYLASCLDSILASIYTDFEIIVVDDKSKDESATIAKNYANRDSRIRFYQNEKNLGDYPNRMRAAELAKGRYLKYVDADDLIYRHSLAIMVDAMEANPDALLGLSHSLPEDQEPYPWRLEPVDAWLKHFLGRGCLSCGPSGAIIRRDALFEIGGFRKWGVINDMDLWLRLAAKGPTLLLSPGLVWWRRHEGQEFTKGNAAWVYLVDGFRMAMEHLQSPINPLPDADTQRAIRKVRQHHARRILSMAVRDRKARLALGVLRSSGLSLAELLEGCFRYR
jgi:glycosyltransferase involved in cell wall biosynthesis